MPAAGADVGCAAACRSDLNAVPADAIPSCANAAAAASDTGTAVRLTAATATILLLAPAVATMGSSQLSALVRW
jgi:hypothetical protein